MSSEKKKMTKGKKSIGRQKIEIKPLKEDSRKQVTFSKRRAGLFKKAAELCILCDAQVAIIAYSTHDNVFCFGHPDVDTLVDHYLSGNTSMPSSNSPDMSADEFKKQYAEAQEEFEMKKKRLNEIEKQEEEKVEKNGGFWWDESLDENMGLEELNEYSKSLLEVRRKVSGRLEEFRMTRSSLMEPVDMAAAPGKYFGLGNDFLIQDWEAGAGNGIAGSHGFACRFGHGKI